MPPLNETAAHRETHRRCAERLGVSTKTLDRWSETGVVPEPVRINGRKYWPIDTEPRRDAGPRKPAIAKTEPADVPAARTAAASDELTTA